jgi:hypothetical protein
LEFDRSDCRLSVFFRLCKEIQIMSTLFWLIKPQLAYFSPFSPEGHGRLCVDDRGV